MDIQALLNPQHAKPGTREFAIGHFAARMTWHRVFDSAPQTERALGGNSSALLRDFMAYGEEHAIPLDWKRHVAFFHWLARVALHPAASDLSIQTELLAATVSSWARDQYVDMAHTRIVAMSRSANISLGAVRPLRFADAIKVVRLKADGEVVSQAPSHAGPVYGTGVSWLITEWMPL